MTNLRLFNVWLLVNVPVIAIIIVGAITGYLNILFNDVTFITHSIFAFIILNVLYTGYTSIKVDRLNIMDWDNVDHLYNYLDNYLKFPRWSIDFVIKLGFLGTIIGVIIGFHYMPADVFTDTVKMANFTRTMLTGFSVELCSLVMSVMGSIWLAIIVYVQEAKLIRIMTSATV